MRPRVPHGGAYRLALKLCWAFFDLCDLARVKQYRGHPRVRNGTVALYFAIRSSFSFAFRRWSTPINKKLVLYFFLDCAAVCFRGAFRVGAVVRAFTIRGTCLCVLLSYWAGAHAYSPPRYAHGW